MNLKSMVVLILIGGCATAPLTDEQQYERDNKETLRLEQFYRDEAACMAWGGIIVIHRWGYTIKQRTSRKMTPPRQYDTYGCMRGGIH